MRSVRTFEVVPSLPDRFARLRDIAMNLWWAWEPEAIKLFFRLDRKLWEEAHQNPACMLGRVSQARLAHLLEDDSFQAHLDRVCVKLDEYMAAPTWYQSVRPNDTETRIAYFCAEYGVTDCLPIFSGGLGILAGDHLKSASDLGIPLVAVGLLYRQGYFRQYLNADGWQQERYPENDFHNMSLSLERDDAGNPITISVDMSQPVEAQIWRAQVGRIPLYLLDANIDSNPPAAREITAQLYGGDKEMRIRQEILLGIGGHRALRALGIVPTACHLNEGHAAFQPIERMRTLMEAEGLGYRDAFEVVRRSTVFTTHTPVPAGHDIFSPEIVEKHLGKFRTKLGLDKNQFLALGRPASAKGDDPFNMTLLAMRAAANTNGVSELHGEVSRDIWAKAWPGFPVDEVPIDSITNGMHTRSWISFDLADLFDRYLGPRWITEPGDQSVWERVDSIPDTELWRTHERRRERLVAFTRRRLRDQLAARGMTQSMVTVADEVLDPEALTIGFARRFATYKRGTLLFRDPDRLARILKNPKRPVQIIFAGKAHPADNAGKEFIREIIHHCHENRFRHSIVFLEDYDMQVARYLVQGVDVWLNNPRRKMEASGTSGMKASANAALNMSIPDGWWCEAYDGENGWYIGRGEEYEDLDYQDQVESQAIYEMLEDEIVPLYYDRGADGVPRHWIARMKHALRTICPHFNTNRMVQEYTQKLYIPSADRMHAQREAKWEPARALTVWKERVAAEWGNVAVKSVATEDGARIAVGEGLTIHAEISLGNLAPEDVAAEVYYGPVDSKGNIVGAKAVRMVHSEKTAAGDHQFSADIRCETSGQHGFSVRVFPHHADLVHREEMALIAWG